MTVRILAGDCRDILRTLPDQSVHCCVTSPPYFGLRDYQTATWEGNDSECNHQVGEIRTGMGMATLSEQYRGGGKKAADPKPMFAKSECPHCGARRVDQQMGLEPTPDEFVAGMVDVFREVRRVLRDDGTLWLNIGDSYGREPGKGQHKPGDSGKHGYIYDAGGGRASSTAIGGDVKPKDLIGIPWMLAFALRADGWYLRSEIIWHKPNPMPESVTDRPTKAHEQIFLLTKSPRYYYDAEAIKEPADPSSLARLDQNIAGQVGSARAHAGGKTNGAMKAVGGVFRNARSVWTIATKPFTEAHFATFPPDLPERCIKAGTSERGCCAACGAPWLRVVEKNLVPTAKAAKRNVVDQRDYAADAKDQGANRQKNGHVPGWARQDITLGWRPSCQCDASIIPCTVLDPFGGAGTTGLVADRLQRHAILIELNPEYAEMARRRIAGDASLLAEVGA